MNNSAGIILAFATVAACDCFAQASAPAKLDVKVNRRGIQVGEEIALTITALTAANQPARLARPFPLLLQSRLGQQKPVKLADTFLQPGQAPAVLKVRLETPGLQYIWVKNPELLPGGVYVSVRSASAEPLPAPPPPSPQAAGPGAMVLRTLRFSPLLVTLRSSPERTFLANGKDLATIEAFLLKPDAAPSDVLMNIYDPTGTLSPSQLSIPRGKSSGHAQISAATPGTYKVEFLSSSPQAQLDGDRSLSVHFGPSITRLSLHISPPSISLMDKADLVVQFTDEAGIPVSTDVPRTVSFQLDSGRGGLNPAQLTVPAGQYEARSSFVPQSNGTTVISAASPSLLSEHVTATVAMPIGLLGTAAAGGLIGGYVASLRGRRRKLPMLLTGLVTGFMLYWACVFLGFAPAAFTGTLLNPLSAFGFSVIGGWLQTEVLTTLAKLFQAGKAA